MIGCAVDPKTTARHKLESSQLTPWQRAQIQEHSLPGSIVLLVAMAHSSKHVFKCCEPAKYIQEGYPLGTQLKRGASPPSRRPKTPVTMLALRMSQTLAKISSCHPIHCLSGYHASNISAPSNPYPKSIMTTRPSWLVHTIFL